MGISPVSKYFKQSITNSDYERLDFKLRNKNLNMEFNTNISKI